MHGVDEPRLHAMHVVYYGIYLPDDSLHAVDESRLHFMRSVWDGKVSVQRVRRND